MRLGVLLLTPVLCSLACGPSADPAAGSDEWPRCDAAPPAQGGESPLAGPPSECASYTALYTNDDVDTIPVWLHNEGPEPIIIVPRGCNENLFRVDGWGGGADAESPFDCTWQLACPTQFGLIPGGCVPICDLADLVRVEPGGAHVVDWPALMFYRYDSVPQSCVPEGEDADPCFVASPPVAGSYAVFARAAAASTCDDPELCTCEPDELGSCVLHPYAKEAWNYGEILPQRHDVETVAHWDGLCSEIHLVFR